MIILTIIIIMIPPSSSFSQPPLLHFHHWVPSPSPSPSPSPATAAPSLLPVSVNKPPPSPSKSPVDFSPPLIAMVVIVATAFLVVTYSRLISRHLMPPIHRLLRRWRHRRRRSYLPSSSGDLDSLPYDSPFDAVDNPHHMFSPYGLDESVIKTIPFFLYTGKSDGPFEESSRRDCAVCLLEFEDDEYVRTLPVCSHTFHVDCIDVWLRSHANCPLCRAGVLCAESPFTPMMAARIRPSFDDDTILHRISTMEPLVEAPSPILAQSLVSEITPCIEDQNNGNSEDGFNNGGRDFLLKRSYSFGFERSLASERMVMEATTASPWRYHRRGSSSSFWSKRPSPFGSLGKARVFSFRYYRGMKSPFFRRRGFLPSYGGGSSSRRSKSIASPMFLRSSALAAAGVAAFSSSRLRCGDPEALLSPERYNRR